MAKRVVEKPEQQPPDPKRQAVAVRSGGAAAQQTLRNVRLIIGREYKNRVTQRSFIITTIILLALVVIAAFIPTIVQFIASRTSTPSQTHIVVVNNAGAVAGMDETALTALINTTLNGKQAGDSAPYAITSQPGASEASVADLRRQVNDGKLDILLEMSRTPDQRLQFTYVTNQSETSDGNLSAIQTLALELTFFDTAHRLGLTPAQVRSLSAPPDVTVNRLLPQNARPDNQLAAGYILSFAGAYLLFYAVMTYSVAVANGVVEEKSSRVMELLLNAATPWQLLVGKIIGIGVAGLTQMVCLVVVGIGAILLQGPIQAALFGGNAGGFIGYLSGVSIPFLLLFLVYFLLAFFLYSALFAGLAALVKRQDEVQSVIQIPLFLLVAGMFLVYIVALTPPGPLTTALSYVPFWTPMLMLVRLGLGMATWWEVVITIALMVVAIVACAWFAARLYRYGVLMYGQKPSLRQLLGLMRAK
ncbi:MAG TPA: ABC transporter permease [Ktedonobacterales bacterium]|nr:ABC transporter permease [Ktedonobacterales bacterium]